jgi:uncharacterized protein with GYD domain
MPTYIGLYKLTDQGIKDIKNGPQRFEQGMKSFEKMGGKLLGFYAVMGEYDYVAVGEFPNDEVAMTWIMGISSLGSVRIKTLKAFPIEEFHKLVKKLP